jgi:hypothetical protein
LEKYTCSVSRRLASSTWEYTFVFLLAMPKKYTYYIVRRLFESEEMLLPSSVASPKKTPPSIVSLSQEKYYCPLYGSQKTSAAYHLFNSTRIVITLGTVVEVWCYSILPLLFPSPHDHPVIFIYTLFFIASGSPTCGNKIILNHGFIPPFFRYFNRASTQHIYQHTKF